MKLFLPRPPLPYAPSLDRPPKYTKINLMGGIAGLLSNLPTIRPSKYTVPSEDKNTQNNKEIEAKEDRIKLKKKREDRKKRRIEEKLRVQTKKWNPSKDKKITSDPFKTLIVYNLSHKTTEKILYHAFMELGEVRSIRIIEDKKGKSKGYGFVEFSSESDLKRAFKYGKELRIDGYNIKVDVERGRTVKGWKPRRLGGGLGGRK